MSCRSIHIHQSVQGSWLAFGASYLTQLARDDEERTERPTTTACSMQREAEGADSKESPHLSAATLAATVVRPAAARPLLLRVVPVAKTTTSIRHRLCQMITEHNETMEQMN